MSSALPHAPEKFVQVAIACKTRSLIGTKDTPQSVVHSFQQEADVRSACLYLAVHYALPNRHLRCDMKTSTIVQDIRVASTELPPPLAGEEVLGELRRLLQGDMPARHAEEMRRLLAHRLFRRQEGLTTVEVSELAYARAQFVALSLGLSASDLQDDPRRLYALHEWLGLSDGVACTVLSIHYCLALGSIVAHGEGRPELQSFVDELEQMQSVGVFLATELGYGNNVASLETRAVYDPETREFVLTSPTPQSFKFMPNTACAVPKLGVVMARLFSRGKDCGVFPFLVRLRSKNGVACKGVRIRALSEKAGYALDNAMTSFEEVRLPKSQLLIGSHSVLHDDGRFESRLANRHQRFLFAMDRVQTGRVCFTSAAVSVLRAASWVAVKYTQQRLTFGPGSRQKTLLEYRNVQRDVLGAVASAYALTFAIRHVQRRFRLRASDDEAEVFRLVAVIKAVATAEAAAALVALRERCGAVGLLSANRILEYWNQIQGVITAEGDNQLMLLKVGRQLCDEKATGAGAAPQLGDPLTAGPSQWVALFRFREGRLKEEMQEASVATDERARDLVSEWNRRINPTIALAEAHGARVIAECFEAAVNDVREPRATETLRDLYSLWSLRQLQQHTGWFLAEGCLTNHATKQLSTIQDRVCAELEPHARILVDAFDLNNEVIQAPIAEPDYIVAYQRSCHN